MVHLHYLWIFIPGCIAVGMSGLPEESEVPSFPAIYFKGNEIFSTVIFPLPLIQAGQLSVTGKSMATEYWWTT